MALSPNRFGLSCAITTPMKEGGAVDLARLAHHARHVLANGCDTVTLYGTTGEGAALGLPARSAMMGALMGAGIDPATQIYAGVAASSLHEAIEQARIALDAGAKGLLVAPPFYFKGVSDDGLYAWFVQFIEKLGASARNIILYHIPSVTAVDISIDLVQRLKTAYPGIIAGVKDSSGSYANTEALLKAMASSPSWSATSASSPRRCGTVPRARSAGWPISCRTCCGRWSMRARTVP